MKLVSKNSTQFTLFQHLRYFSMTHQSSKNDCHKKIYIYYLPLLPRNPHILARVTRVSTLPCGHFALRAIHNTLLSSPTSPSSAHNRSAQRTTRASDKNLHTVYESCMAFALVYPSRATRAYRARNRLFVSSNSST